MRQFWGRASGRKTAFGANWKPQSLKQAAPAVHAKSVLTINYHLLRPIHEAPMTPSAAARSPC